MLSPSAAIKYNIILCSFVLEVCNQPDSWQVQNTKGPFYF